MSKAKPHCVRVRVSSCTLIVLSVLGNLLHPYWYAVVAFLGADLAQASVTGYCPIATLCRRIGMQFGAVFHH